MQAAHKMREPRSGWVLVLDDLGDGAGGAGLHALAAGDAVLLVGHNGALVAELKGVGGAGVNAHAAADALVGIDNRMGHGLLRSSVVWPAVCAGLV